MRIVSLVPSLTELLAALGLDDEVVGLTRFCVRPAGWKAAKTIVGGTKTVRVDRVVALTPDLVLANREENTREEVEALAERLPDATVIVSDVSTLADALALIRHIGALTQRVRCAEALAARITIAFDRLASPRRSAPRVAYLIWQRPYMAAGGGTFIGAMLRTAGFANVFEGADRYPETTLDALRALRLDVLLLSSEPFPFREAHAADLGRALPDTHVLLVDGEAFSWYGSRLLHAPAHFASVHAALNAE